MNKDESHCINSVNINSKSESKEEVRRLYEQAFPEIERYPFEDILELCDNGKSTLLGYYDNCEFVGFAFYFSFGNLVYLFYIAVRDTLRSKGYGTVIIRDLVTRNPGKSVIVDIEPIWEICDNLEQRLRRERFYRQLGFEDTEIAIKDDTGTFEIYSNNANVFSEEEYVQSWAIFPEAFIGTTINRRL